MTLSTQELARYNRHIILPELGKEGQERLKAASVLVIGAGGLGCPILQYLTAAGVGTIGIVDFDKVSESNLQRQILYTIDDLGKPKCEVAKAKLSRQNPYITIEAINQELTTDNALELFERYDIIVDGSDNFPTRYLVSDAAVITKKPLVFGSIFKFEGQVSVFNFKDGPTYRCLFPTPPAPGDVPSCAQVGVIGVLPGLIGTIQANEVIKLITGIGEPLAGKLLTIDTLTMQQNILRFKVNPENKALTELTDYERFCGIEAHDPEEVKAISCDELSAHLQEKKKVTLIDVRESFEHEIGIIEGSMLIPMNTIPAHIAQVPRDHTVVVYCHHGYRSASVIQYLQKEYGFNNLLNLSGGIHEWSEEIDGSIPVY